jgi:hypothetical protein
MNDPLEMRYQREDIMDIYHPGDISPGNGFRKILEKLWVLN